MFPEEVHLSRESEDLIRRMVTSADQRVGSGPGGATDIKRHPFFAGVDWDTIRNIEAPFVPHLKSTFDTVSSLQHLCGLVVQGKKLSCSAPPLSSGFLPHNSHTSPQT